MGYLIDGQSRSGVRRIFSEKGSLCGKANRTRTRARKIRGTRTRPISSVELLPRKYTRPRRDFEEGTWVDQFGTDFPLVGVILDVGVFPLVSDAPPPIPAGGLTVEVSAGRTVRAGLRRSPDDWKLHVSEVRLGSLLARS